jgi:hypothetical protein
MGMGGKSEKVQTFTLDDIFDAWATDDEGKAHEALCMFNLQERETGEVPETLTITYQGEDKFTDADFKADILYAIEEGKKYGLPDWRPLEFLLNTYEEKSKSLLWGPWVENDKIHDLTALISTYSDLVMKLKARETVSQPHIDNLIEDGYLCTDGKTPTRNLNETAAALARIIGPVTWKLLQSTFFKPDGSKYSKSACEQARNYANTQTPIKGILKAH